MAYTPSTWTDEVLSGSERYNIKTDGGSAIETNVQIELATSVAVAGTLVDAAKMNNIETGIDNAHDLLASTVNVTGNQTVAGVKTFSSSPIVPTPTTDMQSATKKYVDDNISGGGGGKFACDGRLTLTSGLPVTTADVTGATNVYFTAFRGNQIALYNGSSTWNIILFSEATLALGTVTSGLPYDVFAYNNSGTIALEKLAWTNGTTRATALTLQDGVLVKSGATTRRYLGTFYTTSTSATEDSVTKRFLWNYYNRTEKNMYIQEATDNWTYTTATWRSANNSTANRVQFIIGVAEDNVTAFLQTKALNATGAICSAGIALDATNTSNAQVMGTYIITVVTMIHARYTAMIAAGFHYLQWTEYSQASGTTTWYGDNNFPTLYQSGLMAEVKC